MTLIKIQKQNIFIGISIIVLFISTFFNVGSRVIDGDWYKNFDLFSNGIMIADMNYRQNYQVDSYFQKIIHPGMVMKDGIQIKSGQDLYDTYVSNGKYDKEDYKSYYSNITIHRYVYAFFDKILPFSNNTTINIFYMINALLLSIVLTIIINWLKNYTNLIVGYITLGMTACLCPSVSMYGVNLYWISWSLFLPIVASICIVESKYFNSKSKAYIFPMMMAFLVCTLKQLFYFEFLSTVMVAMMIPYILICLDKKYNMKESIKVLIYPTIGALISFIAVSSIRFALLIAEFSSVSKAKSVFFDAIFRRLTGELDSLDPAIAESAKIPLIQVIKIMGVFPAYSLKKIFSLSYFGVIFIFISVSIYLIYLVKKNKISSNNKLITLMISTLVSMLAPLSWFILAKPHTYIHNFHCTFIWSIPFVPLVTAFIVYFITILFKNDFRMRKKINDI